MKLKTVKVEDSIGRALAHDVTKIVPDRFKGPAYRRGHIIQPEDIPALLDLGKEHVYVLELERGDIHEDEASVRLAMAVAGPGLRLSEPVESRVNLVATSDGLLRVDIEGLKRLNTFGYLALATLHDATVVRQGDTVSALKPLPLVLSEEDVLQATEFCEARRGLVRVLPFRRQRVGVVITGGEVAKGRIKDEFGAIVVAKAGALGCFVAVVVCVTDDPAAIAQAIHGVACISDLILVTGGMSIDPDDATQAGVRLSGARIERFGAPVMPGAMLLLAYLEAKPVIGVPACALFYSTTVLDLILPRLLADDRVTGADIAALGHGGLCRTPAACGECTFPHCEFGKG